MLKGEVEFVAVESPSREESKDLSNDASLIESTPHPSARVPGALKHLRARVFECLSIVAFQRRSSAGVLRCLNTCACAGALKCWSTRVLKGVVYIVVVESPGRKGINDLLIFA